MTRQEMARMAGRTGAERRAALAEIRRRAVRLVVKKKRRPSSVAKLFDVTPQTLSKWLRAHRERGARALDVHRSSGRPAALTTAELLRLRQTIVGKNPNQLNFGVLLWTVPIVRALIQRMFGKDLHTTTVGKYLGLLDLTPQRPLPRSYRRNEEQIRRWMQEVYPRIAADARRKQGVLLFLDETGVNETAPAATTWGERGRRPIVPVSGTRRKVNVISAVARTGRLWFRCFKGNLHAANFIDFLKALLHDVRGPIVLVLDSHPAHVAAAAQAFFAERANRLQVEFLPAYAPELNPDEHVWGLLKGFFKRSPLQQGEQIENAVNETMTAMKASRSYVRSIYGHPDLSYIANAP